MVFNLTSRRTQNYISFRALKLNTCGRPGEKYFSFNKVQCSNALYLLSWVFPPALPSSMPAYRSRPIDSENTVLVSSPAVQTSKGQSGHQNHGCSSFKEWLGMKKTTSYEGSQVRGSAAPGDGEKEAG